MDQGQEDKLINFEKRYLLAANILEILNCQAAAYCLEEVELIQKWLEKGIAEAFSDETIVKTAHELRQVPVN